MLDKLEQQPPDALLALIKLYDGDPRGDKIDLGVGVYRTGQGATPVFGAIKAAEQTLVEEQETKAYLGPEGDMGFVHALMPYVFGNDPTRGGRIEGLQTPGGTGAVRLALALAKRAGATRVLMGTPSWPNHAQVARDLDLELVTFPHATDEGTANLAALKEALAEAGETDVVLLHGSCHNPTGIDYTPEQWDEIAALLAAGTVLPVVDLAYQGLGHGIEEDAYGVRKLVDSVPEALIAQSCDKNFGLYRDRVGALYVLATDAEELPRVLSNAYGLARAAWSMPPDHGAAAVRLVLRDSELTEQWLDELEQMRVRIRQVRAALADAGRLGSIDLAPLGHQNGMFTMLPLTREQVEQLRKDHGIYMAGSGRINVAGLTMDNIPKFTAALAEVAAETV